MIADQVNNGGSTNDNETPEKTTRSKKESGHAKTLAAFVKMIALVDSIAAYKPFKPALAIGELRKVADTAKAAFEMFKTSNVDYDKARHQRTDRFKNVRQVARRAVRALELAGALPQTVETAKALLRKLQGSRRKALDAETLAKAESNTVRSVSQTSFDHLADHFSKLIEIVKAEPNYKPNEATLTVEALVLKLAELYDINEQVAIAHAKYVKARQVRDDAFYNADTGLVILARQVKSYVKMLGDTSRPELSAVIALKFTVQRSRK